MKSRLILIAAALFAAAVSCSKPQSEPEGELDAPSLRIASQSATSFDVVWDSVEGASSYGYDFEGKQGDVQETGLSFSELESDRVYVLKVRALSETAKSEWAEISVELSSDTEEPAKVDFNIQVEVDGTSVIVKTTPSDKEFPYYFEPVPESMYEDGGADAETFFRKMMDDFAIYFGSAQAAFEKIARVGDKELRYDLSKYAEERVYVLLGGIDGNLNVTTAVECVPADLELPSSDNKFEITFPEVTQTSVLVSVSPSNDDPFAIIFHDAKTVDSMSESQLRGFLAGLVSDNNLCSGQTNMLYEKNIVPSHDYSVFVFGWDGTFTTALNRKDVRTLDPEEVDKLTFELTADVTGPVSADCKIVPSNQNASYFYDVIAMQDWTGKYGSDPRNYIEQMAQDKNWTVVKYLSRFGSVGTQEYTYGDSYLKPDSEFVLFAIGYQISGDDVTYLEPQHITFSTPAQ